MLYEYLIKTLKKKVNKISKDIDNLEKEMPDYCRRKFIADYINKMKKDKEELCEIMNCLMDIKMYTEFEYDAMKSKMGLSNGVEHKLDEILKILKERNL